MTAQGTLSVVLSDCKVIIAKLISKIIDLRFISIQYLHWEIV